MDEAALLAAIAAQPAEDTPRLAYADWLDEHAGDLPDPAAARIRAEFIRVQCEIHTLEDRTSTELQGYANLYRRQDALLTRHLPDLLGPIGRFLDHRDVGFERGLLTHRDVVFKRGFLTELTVDAEFFIDPEPPGGDSPERIYAVDHLQPLPLVTVTGFARHLYPLEIRRFCEFIGAIEMQTTRWDEPEVLGPLWEDTLSEWHPAPRLRSINWANCGLTDLGLQTLVSETEGPPFPALTALDLSNNEITDEGVQLLVASPLWPRLKYLVLGANPIGEDGADALADAPPTALEYLNLKYTAIGPAGQQRLLRRKGWKVDLF